LGHDFKRGRTRGRGGREMRDVGASTVGRAGRRLEGRRELTCGVSGAVGEGAWASGVVLIGGQREKEGATGARGAGRRRQAGPTGYRESGDGSERELGLAG
jgi:hypothetical protein